MRSPDYYSRRTFHLGLGDVLVPLWHAVPLDVDAQFGTVVSRCAHDGLIWSSVVIGTTAAATTALL
jgi:hypothetical protein